MHMADALLSPGVATTMYMASAAAAAVSIAKLRKDEKRLILNSNENNDNDKYSFATAQSKLPVMAVTAALVFAAQMINYTIPGTGSSGHLCGGMMLSGLLGPFAGFLSMIVVLAIQCLFFADGGLMALGANAWNMSFYGCFIGYFLIYRPIMRGGLFSGSGINSANRKKIVLASILGCVITLQLGAFSVVLETSASGITELPFGVFLGLMQPIHLAIGLIEGLITSAVFLFIYETRPELLRDVKLEEGVSEKLSFKKTIAALAVVVLIVGGGLSLFASGNPDGLEWSLFGNAENGYSTNMGLDEENYGVASTIAEKAQAIQEKTAFLPDYAFSNDEDNAAGTTVSGIIGSAMVALFAIIVCLIGGFFKRKYKSKA